MSRSLLMLAAGSLSVLGLQNLKGEEARVMLLDENRTQAELEYEYLIQVPGVKAFHEGTLTDEIIQEMPLSFWELPQVEENNVNVLSTQTKQRFIKKVFKSVKKVAKKTVKVAKKVGTAVLDKAKQAAAALSKAMWPYKPTGYLTTKEELRLGMLDLRMARLVYEKSPLVSAIKNNGLFPKEWKSAKVDIEVYSGSNGRGFMYFVNTNDTLFLTFRGTSNTKDAEADIKSQVLGTFSGIASLVGSGFAKHYSSIQATIAAKNGYQAGLTGKDCAIVKRAKFLSNDFKKPIRVVGHSLGGALANLAALEIYEAYFPDVQLHTFGAPRTFNKDWSSKLQAYCDKSTCIRWVNWGDTITVLPLAITGFRHVGSPRYINHARVSTWSNKKKWELKEYDQDMSAEPWNILNHKGASYYSRMLAAGKELFGQDFQGVYN